MSGSNILSDARCCTTADGGCIGNGCIHDTLENQIVAAIADPGSFTPREKEETISRWGTRVVLHIIQPYLRGQNA